MKKKRRILYLDLLSITASFCVVAMHCNGIVHHYSDTLAWRQSLVVEVLAYWAVPVFFMLSGATLLNYRNKYSTSVFIKKRITKTLIPFCVWSIIACVYKCITGVIDFRNFSINGFISMFVKSRFENIYWFFIPLFAVYMSIPVLACLTKEHEKYLWYMFGMGGITISILPFLFDVFRLQYNPDLAFPLTGGYIIFAIEGYLLAKTELPKRVRRAIYIAGLLGVLARYVGTVYLSVQQNELNMLFWGYLNWPSVFWATSVFVFFKYNDWRFLEGNARLENIISWVSSACFGIYLTHIFVLHILYDFFGLNTDKWQWRTFGIFIVYAIALICVKILQKIPVVKKIIP